MDVFAQQAKLAEIAKLEADWDGLGADAPDPDALATAGWLTWLFAAPSRIVAGPSGSIVFERQGEGRIAVLTIEDGELGLTTRMYAPREYKGES